MASSNFPCSLIVYACLLAQHRALPDRFTLRLDTYSPGIGSKQDKSEVDFAHLEGRDGVPQEQGWQHNSAAELFPY